MTENQKQPREFDAVLGGQNIPKNAAVLGGIEGVKMRLSSDNEQTRIAAIKDGMKYGEVGLDLAIASLNDKSPQVRQTLINLLQEQPNHPKVKALTESDSLPLIFTTSKQEKFIGEIPTKNRLIKIYEGDITNLSVDVIVSSDDTRLKMAGGVSRRIREVGGENIYTQVRKITPINLGEIAVTDAGKLQAKKVFHPAVIDYSNRPRTSPEVIKLVACNCIAMAGAQYKMKSIAFPLLATGTGCLEPQEVWEALLWAVKNEVSNNIQEVAIAIYGRGYAGRRLKQAKLLESITDIQNQPSRQADK